MAAGDPVACLWRLNQLCRGTSMTAVACKAATISSLSAEDPGWAPRPSMGPVRAGKGMHSRLYRRVLNQYSWMQNCTAFNSLYDTSGLVGISATVDSRQASQGVDVITKELLVPPSSSVYGSHMTTSPVLALEQSWMCPENWWHVRALLYGASVQPM